MDLTRSVPKMVKRQEKNSKERKRGKDSLKVVYISSPMKVKTSASRFMSLVQQLTGKNSDIAQYVELKDDRAGQFLEIDLNDGALVTQEETSDHEYLSSISNSNDTATCNDSSNSSFFHGGLMTTQMEEQFAGIFGSDSFCDPSLVDVLGSYHEL